MSINNGVYILSTPAPDGVGREFRVKHLVNYIDRDDGTIECAREEWSDCLPVRKERVALAAATILEEEVLQEGYAVEYGVEKVEIEEVF